jgi:hypothetical protein
MIGKTKLILLSILLVLIGCYLGVELGIESKVYTQAERQEIIDKNKLDTTGLPIPEIRTNLIKNYCRAILVAFFVGVLWSILLVDLEIDADDKFIRCLIISILAFLATFLILNSLIDHPYIPFKPTTEQITKFKISETLLKDNTAYYNVRRDVKHVRESRSNKNELGVGIFFSVVFLIFSGYLIFKMPKATNE